MLGCEATGIRKNEWFMRPRSIAATMQTTEMHMVSTMLTTATRMVTATMSMAAKATNGQICSVFADAKLCGSFRKWQTKSRQKT